MHFCLFRKDMSVGGITVVSYRLAKGLMAMGHQVDYVTFDSAGPMREIAPSGLNIIDIGKSTSGRGLKRYLLSPRLQALPPKAETGSRHLDI